MQRHTKYQNNDTNMHVEIHKNLINNALPTHTVAVNAVLQQYAEHCAALSYGTTV